MGHRLLGGLPMTQNWQKVVMRLAQTDNVSEIAEATSKAAKRGLEIAKKDQGVVYSVYMLMKLVWASRASDFRGELAALGMELPERASLLDIVGAFDETVDRRLMSAGHRTDMAEMARAAAVETLGEMCKAETGSLFGVTAGAARDAIKKYATTERFGRVGQQFFGKFLYRFLDYHLSRQLPNHIGVGQQLRNIAEHDEFKRALALHCHQTARIVREFAGCWPSATEYREGITAENVRDKFVPVAFKKIRSELKKREGVNG